MLLKPQRRTAGTLTQNVMGFVWCTIDGQLYGKQSNAQGTPHTISGDAALLLALQRKGSPQQQAAVAFLTHLAICNTVVPARNAQGELVYQASIAVLPHCQLPSMLGSLVAC